MASTRRSDTFDSSLAIKVYQAGDLTMFASSHYLGLSLISQARHEEAGIQGDNYTGPLVPVPTGKVFFLEA